MKKTIVAAAVLVALSLTGCMPQPIEFEAAPETMPAVDPSESQQVWADAQINAWAKEYRGVGIKDAVEERCITGWDSPSEGVLRVEVGCGKVGSDIEWLAGDILREGTDEDLKTVITVSDQTGGTATCQREWSNRCETSI